jgi:hypothetical protein
MSRVPVAVAILLGASACSSNPAPESPTPPAQTAVETQRPQTPPVQTPPTPPPPTPQPAGAFDPLGTFTFTLDIAGTAASGTIDIRKTQDGTLAGAINSDQGSLPLSSVAVESRKMTLRFDFNGAPVSIVMNFEGDKYTGTVNVDGMGSGPISGERKRG